MVLSRDSTRKARRFLAKYFLYKPFLFIVSIFDFFIGLILPYKYDDPALPDQNGVFSRQVDPKDPKSPYRSTLVNDLLVVESKEINLYSCLQEAVKTYFDLKTMGVREILAIDDEVQPNGKVFKKHRLGQYKWMKYEEVLNRVDNFSNGLLHTGLKSNMNIVLFAETRPEWIMSAFACFRIKVPIVTLYATLGVDALAYGINQTSANYVFTSSEQLPKLQKIIQKIPNITHVIVFDDKFMEKNLCDFKIKCSSSIKVFTMSELETLGKESPQNYTFERPNKNDLAIIMYTSGSTGNPKGVMISHGNLVTTIRAFLPRFGTLYHDKDIFIAFLPLAHVLELVLELVCLTGGITIGYSTPQTLTDTATAIRKGEKGDLRVLKPTLMPAVPIILERISKTVYEKLAAKNWRLQLIFRLTYKQKLEAFRAGRSSRLLDRLLFKSISRAVLGGKVRLMVSGGAMLSKEVQEFIQVVFCPLIQGYGLTETCGSGTTQFPTETQTEVGGSVVSCCEIRLVDWPEGGYRITDKPNPRGEVYIGGDSVTMGYYNMPEKTAEDYSVINGIRYFATGDIGEMLPNGNLKLVDRKKDLVKLSGGEYVSLNKIESVVKLLPFIDNCCVVADSLKSFCVLLACPNIKKVSEYIKEDAKSSGGEEVTDVFAYLDTHPKLVEKLTKEMLAHCLERSCDRFEVPTKIGFVKEIWLPDTGLVTDSLKLKRKEIEKFYKSNIELLYK